MRFTPLTHSALNYRRARAALEAQGFEHLGEGGGTLWQLYRGSRTSHRITDVRILPGGKDLMVKIEPPTTQGASKINGR